MSTPGPSMSGQVRPSRSPRGDGVAVLADRDRLQVVELDARWRRTRRGPGPASLAATEITQGAWLNGLTLDSPFSSRSCRPRRRRSRPRGSTALVATLTGSAGSYWRKLLPQELLMTSMPSSVGLAQHVVVGGDHGGGRDHRADREAGQLGVGGDPEVVGAGGAVGGDDAGDVGAVAAAEVGVVVGALVRSGPRGCWTRRAAGWRTRR